MKKYLVAILMVSALFLSGCKEKKESNVIKFITSADYPPFEYLEQGELIGFDIDLARLIAKELGKEAIFENMGFSTILPALASGQADAAISTIAITDERSKSFDFSTPYYFDKLVAVFAKDKPVTTKEDLAGKKIACQLGTVMEIWLKNNIPDAKIMAVDTNNFAIESLKSGHVDSVFIDAVQGATFSKNNPDLAYAVITEADDGYGIAFKKGSLLKTKVNQALQNLQENGQIKKLQEKWIEAR